MDITLLILLVMVAAAIVTVLWKGRWRLIALGFKQAAHTFQSMWLRVLIGFTLGGLFQVLIPNTLIVDWLGPASGLKGILIGSYVGIIITGGPYVTLPIIASIYAAGAGVGPVIALLTGANLISLPMLITWQIPFIGVRVALARYVVCLFIPPLAGLAGAAIYQLLNLA